MQHRFECTWRLKTSPSNGGLKRSRKVSFASVHTASRSSRWIRRLGFETSPLGYTRAGGNPWRSFASAGLVGRKVIFNIVGLFLIVLGESTPLCAMDLAALPANVSQLVMHGSVAACSSQATPILHVFMLGIVPYVEAAIFVQLLTATVGWRRLPLPERYHMSQEQAQTSYGRAATVFLSSILGTIIASVLAMFSVQHFISQGVVGQQEFWSMSTSLVAGSAMVHMFSDMLTRYGLGQGIGFIYMVLIASREPSHVHRFPGCLHSHDHCSSQQVAVTQLQ